MAVGRFDGDYTWFDRDHEGRTMGTHHLRHHDSGRDDGFPPAFAGVNPSYAFERIGRISVIGRIAIAAAGYGEDAYPP